jgi:hypothetical protein
MIKSVFEVLPKISDNPMLFILHEFREEVYKPYQLDYPCKHDGQHPK